MHATSGTTLISYKRQKTALAILFLFSPLFLLILFTYIPVINMGLFSLTDWNGYDNVQAFIGIQNYIELFTDPSYFSVFVTSLYYLVGAFVQLALALYFATILSFKLRGSNFFKGAIFFPYLLNGVAVGFIFLYFYRPEGVLDQLLIGAGMGQLVQQWIGNRQIINISLAAVSVWRYMGLNFVMFMGAIQSIPSDIYEVSEIDGASRWQQFWYIIIPSIMPIISLSSILAVRGALSVFEIPYVMTLGANGSSTFVIQTVNEAFKLQRIGLASAMAVVLMVLTLGIAALQHYALERKEKES
jgi:raffinose/stachyose/melibiose transport system permease protein